MKIFVTGGGNEATHLKVVQRVADALAKPQTLVRQVAAERNSSHSARPDGVRNRDHLACYVKYCANRERADLEWTSGICSNSFSHRLDRKTPGGTEWLQ